MTDFRKVWNYDEIPDPYYGGEEGFELVLDLLEDSCEGLLEKLAYSK
jgi:protein-tyrosine phosphatase